MNIDDTWEAQRDAQGNIQANAKFPDMKALADYRRLLHRAEKLRDPKRNPDGYRSAQAVNAENAFYEQRNRAMRVASTSPDPTALLVIDEADRLKMAGLEQVRSISDHVGIGLVLIGMPGIEKRLARYPRFYSRIGFVHEFSAIGCRRDSSTAGTRPGATRSESTQAALGPETFATIIRMTGGNFRLLNRLLTQMERILEINSLREVTKAVVEAARESLVHWAVLRKTLRCAVGRVLSLPGAPVQ